MFNSDAAAAGVLGPLVIVLVVVVLLLLVLAMRLNGRLSRLEQHYRMLTVGTEGGNLQDVLEDHIHQVQIATERSQALESAVRALERNSRQHVQHMGFLRFNPFRETGGDQSFVLALADGEGNGAVLSTLHSRDVTRVYAKPLVTWQSTYPLTEEEQQVIMSAKRQDGVHQATNGRRLS